MEENKIRHLEMIQGVINRMANNSFMLKGWAVTLVSGIFILASKDADKLYFLVSYIPVIVFFFLKVRKTKENDIDFSLKASSKEFGNATNSLLNCLVSKTEILFYFPLAIVSAIVIILRYSL